MTDKRKRIALRLLFEQLMRDCLTPEADPESILIRYHRKLARLRLEFAK